MNKFRVSLHPALFFPGSNWYSEDPNFRDYPEAENNVHEWYQASLEEYQVAGVEEANAAEEAFEQQDNLTGEVRSDLQGLGAEVDEADATAEETEEVAEEETGEDEVEWDETGEDNPAQKVEEEISNFDSNFFNFFNKAGTEVQNRRHERGWLTRKQMKMVINRHKENISKWNKNVKEWYEDLLKTLLKNKYFDSPVSRDVNAIREMYSDVVAKQYETYVWDSEDKVFDEIKNKLFTKDMGGEYSANLVYKKLNNDAEIFERDVQERFSYKVDAVHTEHYKENKELVDSWEWRDKSRFLSETLPNYLWGISSTKFWQKLLQYTPFVGNKIDKVSDNDKKWIRDFVGLVEDLQLKEGVTTAPEVLLLNVFKDADSRRTQQQWKDAFEENGLEFSGKDKFIKNLNKAYQFYAESQSPTNSVDKQHNLYLSVLWIVETEWWFNETIAKFKDDAEMYAKEKRNLEAWELEKENPELYSLSEKLNKNYEATLNLSKMSTESFADRNAVDIVADFNNDGAVLQSDRWAEKSWLEFREISKGIGEEKALQNLLNHAKLLNKSLWLWLTDEDLNLEQIKAGNKKLILLLQSIASQPWEDLYTLLTSWTDATEKYADQLKAMEEAPKSPEDSEVKAAADKLLEWLEDIDIDELKKIEWFNTAATREWLHQAVAWALYTEYTKALGLWATIPFDKWVDWLAVNGWFQVWDTWLSMWLTLSYKKELELWKWWTVTPQTSIGYTPFVSFEWWEFSNWWTASAWAEIAKKWINDKDVAQKIWLNLSYTRVFGTANVYSALVWRNRDKLAWVEGSVEKKKEEYNEIVSPLIDTIGEFLNWRPLDLNDDGILNGVKDILNSKVDELLDEDEKSKLWAEWKQKFIDNTMRYLCNFNNLDLSSKAVKDMVANDMSERYALAREHATKWSIDWKSYLSWARLWFSWVQLWAYGVGIVHAGLSWTKHMKDVYWDWKINRHEVFVEHFDVINEEALNKINNLLNLDNVELKFNDEWYVVIPNSLLRNVYINAGMKWNIKKDENGNVLIHKETVLELPTITYWTTTKSVRLNVGWDGDSVQLISSVINDPEWFTDWDINPEELTWKEEFTMDLLKRVLGDLKSKVPELSEYHFDESILSQLQYGHKYKITLTKEWKEIKAEVEEVKRSQKDLTIEYKSFKEASMMSTEAQDIANCVYAEAWKVVTNALYNISHTYKFKNANWVENTNRERPQYTKFALAMRDGNYEEARNVLVGIDEKGWLLSKIEKELNKYGAQKDKIKFSYKDGESEVSVSDKLKSLTWAELGKALMSINNIFARVGSVKWWPDGYTFKYGGKGSSMDKIVESRAKNIASRINNDRYLPQEAKDAYQSLITFAENYRTKHPEAYADSKKQARFLDNAIGFNLWNSYNVENPLFNPEIYEGSLIEDLNFNWKDILMERALENIANNKVLFDPIKTELKLDWDVKVERYENGQLMLDIWWEKVKLSAEMKFAYFAQCVNHMLIIDNIRAERGKDWGAVDFWNSVLRDGRVNEWTVKERMATITTSVDFAVKVPGQTWGDNSEVKSDDSTDWWKMPDTGQDDTQEVPTDPNPAWNWDDTISGGDEV